MLLNELKNDLQKLSNPEKAVHSKRFFKTGPGDYGEGDQFLGITVPNLRKVAKKHTRIFSIDLMVELLKSPIHEERLTALFMMVYAYQKANDKSHKESIAKRYIAHFDYVNNWDLVDSSAHYILGDYFLDKDRSILREWAASDHLWTRRIAMMTTFFYIRQGKFDDALIIAEILVGDSHDLIHKAVGWMLREIGKRDQLVEESFLKKYYLSMPRTMLRYAIEKFPEPLRRQYMSGGVYPT